MIERTVRDAVGGPTIPDDATREARRSIAEPPNNALFSFFWWLSCVYEEPESVRQAIDRAVASGQAALMRYGNGRRHAVHWVLKEKTIPLDRKKNPVIMQTEKGAA